MDSHTHIDFFAPEQLDRCFRDALSVGVDHFVVPGVSRDKWLGLPVVAKRENVFFAFGEHPLELANISTGETRAGILSKAVEMVKKTPTGSKLVAIGEIGLDYYRLSTKDLVCRGSQRQALCEQLSVAAEKNLPVIIHCRDKFGAVEAWNDVISSIEKCGNSPGNILFHSFSYGQKQVEEWTKMGGYISISGLITKPNSTDIRDALQFIPKEQMLLETDSPFLLPQALRIEGKEQTENEPKNVVEVARVVGEILNKDASEILLQTRENGMRFFRIR
ncbi:MAG: TatD family hydrolase [Puniceicoccales bacterium]|jgi:TatD DNase family protein|nr:TatD family hydrolase [Puniceicoccales bacterium]